MSDNFFLLKGDHGPMAPFYMQARRQVGRIFHREGKQINYTYYANICDIYNSDQ